MHGVTKDRRMKGLFAPSQPVQFIIIDANKHASHNFEWDESLFRHRDVVITRYGGCLYSTTETQLLLTKTSLHHDYPRNASKACYSCRERRLKV